MNGTLKLLLLALVCIAIFFGNRTGLYLIQGFAWTGVWGWSSLSDFGRFQLMGRGAVVLVLLGGAVVYWGRQK